MRVYWSRAALRDRDRVWLFFADRSVAYADKLQLRIDERARSLALLPKLGRRIHGTDDRELSVPDVQYVIRYRIQDHESIRILRIWHTAQDRSRFDV